ncbi:MAG: type 1 glutamine amidotransferase [Acidimicrobiia bacterium]|nr:type 1 glutamine amidotransferase [Acidimicrobiia bacterium]NNF69713.1 type 1 glutamine amidotransferase [Acidimicrobiia bacterium]
MLLILQHNDTVPPGYLGDAIARAGVETTVVDLWAGDPVPSHEGWAGIVSLGGLMGAYDDEEYPWLTTEKAMLRAAVTAGVPVLGICLGCQVLADALGGRAYKAADTEIAFAPVDLTAAGAADPVVGRMTGSVLTWHQDTWDPPPGAEVLATSDRYPQAFRLGSALGLQPHPEAGEEIATGWASEPKGAAMLDRVGVIADELLAAIRASNPEPMAARLFDAWLAEVAGTTPPL